MSMCGGQIARPFECDTCGMAWSERELARLCCQDAGSAVVEALDLIEAGERNGRLPAGATAEVERDLCCLTSETRARLLDLWPGKQISRGWTRREFANFVRELGYAWQEPTERERWARARAASVKHYQAQKSRMRYGASKRRASGNAAGTEA